MTHTEPTHEELVRLVGGVPALKRQPPMVYDGTDPADPSALEDIWVLDPGSGRLTRLTGGTGRAVSDVSPSWSPGRDRIALARADGGGCHLVVIDAATGADVAAFPHVPGYEPDWVNSRRLVYTADWPDPHPGDLHLLDVVTGRRTRLTAVGRGEQLTSAAWHPRGGLAATLHRDDTTEEVVTIAPAAVVGALGPRGRPVPTAELARVSVPRGLARCSQPAWSPAGDRIACRTTNWLSSVVLPGMNGPGPLSEIVVFDLAGTGYTRVTRDRDELLVGTDSAPVFSPDGRYLAWLRGHEEDAYQIVVLETAALGRIYLPGLRRWKVIATGRPHHMRKSIDW